jgi:hypothetical protein
VTALLRDAGHIADDCLCLTTSVVGVARGVVVVHRFSRVEYASVETNSRGLAVEVDSGDPRA